MSWQVPGYVAEELIGSGSSGQVWRGRCIRTGEPVALKRLNLNDATALAQARSEAALLCSMDHPHLLRVREMAASDTEVVLVLDLAAGGSLQDVLERRRVLTPGEVVTILTPVAAALAYAHHEGVLHNDVSAGNILFTEDGKPLLADLGVARVCGAGGDTVATLGYLDPAVANGAPTGPYTDVFALAAVGFHALTGRPPWIGETSTELISEAARGQVPDLRALAPGIPDELLAVLSRALAREPHLRGTAAEFALDVRRAAIAHPVELGAGRRAAPVPTPSPSRLESQGSQGSSAIGNRSAATQIPAAAARTHLVRAATATSPLGPTSASERPDRSTSASGRPDRAARRTGTAPAETRRHRAHPPAPQPPAPQPRRTSGAAGARVRRIARVMVACAIVCTVGGLVVRATGSTSGAETRGAETRGAGTRGGDVVITTPAVAPTTALSTASSTRAASVVDWAAVLAQLDSMRESAYANARVDLLSQVYAPGPLLAQDSAQLLRAVPSPCTMIGLRTSYADVKVEQRTATGATVTVQAALASASLVCSGKPSGSIAAQGPTKLRIELAEHGNLYWISAQRAIA
jgi:serine/threonine protein kinase